MKIEEGSADAVDASGGAETKKGSNAAKGKTKKRRAETDGTDEQQPPSRKKAKAKGPGGDGKQGGKASSNEDRTASEAFKAAKAKRLKANAAMEEAHAAKKRKQDKAMDVIAQGMQLFIPVPTWFDTVELLCHCSSAPVAN